MRGVKVWQGLAPSVGSGGKFSCPRRSTGLSWLEVKSLQSLPRWIHCLFLLFMCQISLCLSYKNSVIGFEAHPGNLKQSPHLKILNVIAFAKTLVPPKLTFTSWRDYNLTSSGGYYSAYYSGLLSNQKKANLDSKSQILCQELNHTTI